MGVGRIGRTIARTAMVACFMLALLATSAYAAIESPKHLRNYGPDGTSSSSFSTATSIGVDQQAHNVYVADITAGALFKFDEDGNPVGYGGSEPYVSGNRLSGLSFFGGPTENQVAVNSPTHTIYVTNIASLRAFEADGDPASFSAGPGAGTNVIGGFTELVGVAVDSSGNIYASDYGPGGAGTISIFTSAGEPVTSFPVTKPSNIAVAPDGGVYVVEFGGSVGGPVTEFTPSSFPVTGTTTYTAATQPLNPNPVISASVDSTTGDVFLLENKGTFRVGLIYDASGALQEEFGAPGEKGEFKNRAVGIAVAGDAERVYVSTSGPGGPSQVEIFVSLASLENQPTVEGTTVSAITESSAVLRGRINPNAKETDYRFEYGVTDCSVPSSACTSVPAAAVSIGDGIEPIQVSQKVAGLTAGTTYFYRIVAENELGVTKGPVKTFRTPPLGIGFDLSDNRSWEMVSPVNKQGAALRGAEGGLVQAAESGGALVYSSIGTIEPDPQGNRASERSTVLSRRVAGVWTSEDVSPPHASVTPVADGNEYRLFKPDLSAALLQQTDFLPLSPAASDRTIYLRENSKPPTYIPLVTSKEGYANVPPEIDFGADEARAFPRIFIAGASPGLDEVVLGAEIPLEVGGPANALYLWRDGELTPVSRLPVSEGGTFVPAILGTQQGSVRLAVSDGGAKVFWSTGDYQTTGVKTTGLYIRDTLNDESGRLDRVQSGASGAGTASPAFQAASADGSRVLFTDSRQLTADAGSLGRTLYSCEIGPVEGAPGCASLRNITPTVGVPGESAQVIGLVPAVGHNGDRAYFVAKGVLDTDPNGFGESAVSGGYNLYFWEDSQSPRFIGVLSSEDRQVWGSVGAGSEEALGYAGRLGASGSPSGRYFAFMSERSLTGYENRPPGSEVSAQEIFRYDAAADQLECVSCNPGGESPEGMLVKSGSGADPVETWTGKLVAAILPESSRSGGLGFLYPLHSPRTVLDSGRVFFNAADRLVAADSNRTWDVYQYEPLGVGDCTSSTAQSSVSRSENGCVGLISSGTQGGGTFIDASPSGDDVFFLSSAKLSALDEDEVLDVYDARVNGVAATSTIQSQCAGEGCRGSQVAPVAVNPASASFSGRGNLKGQDAKRCGKGKRKVRRQGRVRCIKTGQSERRQANSGRGSR